MDELDSKNGYIWTINCAGQPVDYYIPEELIALILSFVDGKNLILSCKFVCKAWKRIVNSISVREKAERECAFLLKKYNQPQFQKILPWQLYYLILNNVFDRNFLKNSSGQEGMLHWKLWSSGGDGWKVEPFPVGGDPFPKRSDLVGSLCFATSYHSCSKSQVIDLKEEGLSPKMMDALQPDIRISEWYSGRHDCGCIYELKASLLNKKKKPVVDFKFRKSYDQGDDKPWEMVEHTFKKYGPGVRYVTFYHGGMDKQFWKGHYGSKMTCGTVMALIPEDIPETLYTSFSSDNTSYSRSSSSSSSSSCSEDEQVVNSMLRGFPLHRMLRRQDGRGCTGGIM